MVWVKVSKKPMVLVLDTTTSSNSGSPACCWWWSLASLGLFSGSSKAYGERLFDWKMTESPGEEIGPFLLGSSYHILTHIHPWLYCAETTPSSILVLKWTSVALFVTHVKVSLVRVVLCCVLCRSWSRHVLRKINSGSKQCYDCYNLGLKQCSRKYQVILETR